MNAIHYTRVAPSAKRDSSPRPAGAGRNGGSVPKLGEAQKRDRFEAILDSAERVLTQRGYAEAWMGEVARAAGVSDGLIYRYFDGKRDLRDQVLARFYGRVLAA